MAVACAVVLVSATARADELAAARSAYDRAQYAASLEALRAFRAEHPSSPLVPDSLALSVLASLASEDPYKARYFQQKLLAEAPGSTAAFNASISVGRRTYEQRQWTAALEYFRDAVESYRQGASRPDLDLALLRCAEISLYHANQPAAAREWIGKIDVRNLSVAEAGLYREMRVRLLWSTLGPKTLGLVDANISSLRVDGDDLWVGTWNGGVARWSVSSGRSDPFPTPAFTRAIEAADRRIWVGTAEGLAWYGKATGRWSTEEAFAAPSARKVQAVRSVSGRLYAGTLGDGLYRQGDAGWDEVSDGDLPGRFVTCIASDDSDGRLLIGTMTMGLVIMDIATGAMTALAELVPGFTAANITSILCDRDGAIWIGTYGEGLYRWLPRAGGEAGREAGGEASLSRYTKAQGEIPDDWILASCETDRALYFGSFGGGVGVRSKATGAWRKIGIADGLPSLDVAAIAWRAPYVFFGTLGAGVSVYEEASDGAQP
jgi:hypothetical protein